MYRVIASNSLGRRNLPLLCDCPIIPLLDTTFRTTLRSIHAIVYTASSSQPAQLVRAPLSPAILTVSCSWYSSARGHLIFSPLPPSPSPSYEHHPRKGCTDTCRETVSLFLSLLSPQIFMLRFRQFHLMENSNSFSYKNLIDLYQSSLDMFTTTGKNERRIFHGNFSRLAQVHFSRSTTQKTNLISILDVRIFADKADIKSRERERERGHWMVSD